jgi:hypothetical protein
VDRILGAADLGDVGPAFELKTLVTVWPPFSRATTAIAHAVLIFG